MRAVARTNATGHFYWIGSDGWSARGLVTQGNHLRPASPPSTGQEAVVEGTISLQPQAHPVQGFREYFLALTPGNNPRNPWFIGRQSSSIHSRLASHSLNTFLPKLAGWLVPANDTEWRVGWGVEVALDLALFGFSLSSTTRHPIEDKPKYLELSRSYYTVQ